METALKERAHVWFIEEELLSHSFPEEHLSEAGRLRKNWHPNAPYDVGIRGRERREHYICWEINHFPGTLGITALPTASGSSNRNCWETLFYLWGGTGEGSRNPLSHCKLLLLQHIHPLPQQLVNQPSSAPNAPNTGTGRTEPKWESRLHQVPPRAQPQSLMFLSEELWVLELPPPQLSARTALNWLNLTIIHKRQMNYI